jgi:RNA polymerase sigma factor (sigma-70 family)
MSAGSQASAFPAPSSCASSSTATKAGSVGPETSTLDLVSAAKAGSQDAWSEIYRQNRLYVFHICCGFLKNDADQEEAVQDTFLRAWKGLKDFRGDAKLSTWLVRIARHVCLSRIKQLKCPMNDPANYFFLDAAWSAGHQQWSAEDRLEATDIPDPRSSEPDTNILLEELLTQLPESQGKDALMQFHLDGVSDQELAAQMGLSVKAIQRLREKELEKLRDISKKRGGKLRF